ncbi:hypothetical protein ONS95_003786 [Cadophora gregata]|uniref:uncharacterized protein n=1 Tax=Cadophora gregata TaxID=51156 RepID=UPI0026DDCC10|nr:uncharacterized protein ONS95_003786 [Cadophora gregata]KAK0107077.1 hypothetical protein ONS95_003786 [Cadophora gregata]
MSSRRSHHHNSGSGQPKNPGRHQGQSLAREQNGLLASDDSRMILPDRSNAHAGHNVLPTLHNDSSNQKNGSILPSADFRDDTKLKTGYTKPEDIRMAEKQRRYTTLPLAEQKEQDRWAHEKLQTHLSSCPEGYRWTPWTQKGFEGYRCQGGAHLITHKLLAEGQDGVFLLNLSPGSTFGSKAVQISKNKLWSHKVTWFGPLYPGVVGRGNTAAYPGGPPHPMLAMRSDGSSRNDQQPRRDRLPYSGMTRGIGGSSGYRGSMLPSAAFRDDTSAPGGQVVPNSRNIRSGGQEYYGGRTMPKGWTPDQHAYPTRGTQVDPGWPMPPPDFTQGCINPKLLVIPPEGVNNPNYRANYSTIISDYDKAMAEKQLRFKTLSPAEQAVQKKWAKNHLMKTEVCPQGFGWWSYRTDELAPDGCKLEGYRCWAGGHMVTHELLVEDKGRFYTPGIDEDWNDKWAGPVWPSLFTRPTGIGGEVIVTDGDGQPKWKDPNWQYCSWTKPGSSSKKKKKWWKR